MMGTKVITNGNPLEADVRWGVLLRVLAWGGAVLTGVLIVLLSAAVMKVFATASTLEMVVARQVMVLDELKANRASFEAIRDQFAAEDYVTRTELATWMMSPTRRDAVQALSRDEDIHATVEREVERILHPISPRVQRGQ